MQFINQLLRLASALVVATVATTASLAQSSQSENVLTVEPGFDVPIYPEVTGSLRLALNDGLIYSPTVILKHEKVLERMFPKANITWIDLNSTNQIRDALIAGDINAGSCSPLPYFLGWTAGVDWKLLVKMTEFDAILFAQPNGPSTLDELAKATGKIGAGPGTAYDFAIQMALKKEGADQKAFQKRLVQLSVGDAMAAFSTGELAAHFAPADAAILHTEHGSKPVLRLNDVFDAPHFVGVCTTDTAYKTSPQLLGGLREAIKAVVNWMNANRVASDHEILATNDKLTSNVLDAVFSDGLVKWSTTNPRIEVFAAAMSAMGYEKRKANSASEFYIYPEDQANAQ